MLKNICQEMFIINLICQHAQLDDTLGITILNSPVQWTLADSTGPTLWTLFPFSIQNSLVHYSPADSTGPPFLTLLLFFFHFRRVQSITIQRTPMDPLSGLLIYFSLQKSPVWHSPADSTGPLSLDNSQHLLWQSPAESTGPTM